jgi:ribose transport system ATP-binding protein
MRFIHQDLGLVPTLSSVDNLALGRGYSSRRFVRLEREATKTRAAIAEFGFDFDVDLPVSQLRPVERSILAIVRAVRSGANETESLRVLVFDEPTESMGRPEVRRLFDAIRQAAARGVAILYVSHRLDEVLDITDEITVLRDGRKVGTRQSSELDHDALVKLIIGHSLEEFDATDHGRPGDVALSLVGVSGATVREVSLDVHRGEVLGVAGVVGSGREELPYLIGGAHRLSAGSMQVDGVPVDSRSPREALRKGIVLVAADRDGQSAIQTLAVRENLTLPRVETRGPFRWLSYRRERAAAGEWLAQLDVRPPEPERLLASLSGGNQQKVVLARALRCRPRILVVDEPVQGVDIGAKMSIYRLLSEAARTGMSVVLGSSDPEDLALTCDRVVVFRDGRVAAELVGASKTVERITAEMVRPKVPDMERSAS